VTCIQKAPDRNSEFRQFVVFISVLPVTSWESFLKYEDTLLHVGKYILQVMAGVSVRKHETCVFQLCQHGPKYFHLISTDFLRLKLQSECVRDWTEAKIFTRTYYQEDCPYSSLCTHLSCSPLLSSYSFCFLFFKRLTVNKRIRHQQEKDVPRISFWVSIVSCTASK
jgi:hypothetical protein